MSDNNKFSLINFDGASDVMIKLLDMVEKATRWIVLPKNSKADFNNGVSAYIESIKNDDTLNGLEKAAKISTARREVQQYINQGKIIAYAAQDIKDDAPMDVDEDWLMYFFEYAKNITNEGVQTIWGKILAERCNGNTSINRRLIFTLSTLDAEEASMFSKLCNITFSYYEDETNGIWATNFTPNNIPFVIHPAQYIHLIQNDKTNLLRPYFECSVEMNSFLALEELGLIERCELPNAFAYKYNGDIHITFSDKHYKIVSDKKRSERGGIDERYDVIEFGSIKYTLLGNTFYEILKSQYCSCMEIVLRDYLKRQKFNLIEI